MSCNDIADASESWSPPVNITNGEFCSQFLSDILKTRIDGMQVSDYLFPNSTCAPSLKIHGINGTEEASVRDSNTSDYIIPFHLAFNKSAASCMGAPAMGYDPDIPIFNDGRMDQWNIARSQPYSQPFSLTPTLFPTLFPKLGPLTSECHILIEQTCHSIMLSRIPLLSEITIFNPHSQQRTPIENFCLVEVTGSQFLTQGFVCSMIQSLT